MKTVAKKSKIKFNKSGDKSTAEPTAIKVNRVQAAPAQKESTSTAYLSKRILVSAVRRGLSIAAREAMQNQGFNVIAENGSVVKVFANGTREIIKKIEPVKRPTKIILK